MIGTNLIRFLDDQMCVLLLFLNQIYKTSANVEEQCNIISKNIPYQFSIVFATSGRIV